MDYNAAITGWGWYSPAQVLSNHDLEKLVDTNDAWIQSRTGIRERRIAGPNETTSTMGTIAARQALEEAELSARDLDLIICATTTPDHLIPATACLIQRNLGANHAAAFDLNTACSGFLYALATGTQFIQAGGARRILIVAGETLSRFMNWEDRSTCILFGDGAAAVVLEPTAQTAGVLSTVLGSRGDVEHMLSIEAGGSARPASAETLAEKAHCVRMKGNEIFKLAVRSMAQSAQEALAKAGLVTSDLRAVIPHQANHRILTATQDALGVSDQQMFVNIDRYGNTGASSIPIALGEFLQGNAIDVGDHLLFVAFGGGLTWGATVLRWADIPAVKMERWETMRKEKLALTG
ncbi:MAG: ketoacyl-ACP synthase III [Planctomycetes bacterium]|nr:ketoacyl-ACP synthase III [Planctomycetota bacterium]